jgi:hypothetical protein
MIERLKKWYHGLPDKKQHIELFTALLTVPVLVTVIMLNVNNLKNNSQKTPTVVQQPNITIVAPTGANAKTVPIANTQPTTSGQCIKQVGPVSISSPQDGQITSDNPLCFNVAYTVGDYCSVVWSYQIDNGSWSDYSDKDVCLYNLPSGNHTFQLHVKSVVSSDQKTLSRSFTYKPLNNAPTATIQPTSTATSSATINP